MRCSSPRVALGDPGMPKGPTPPAASGPLNVSASSSRSNRKPRSPPGRTPIRDARPLRPRRPPPHAAGTPARSPHSSTGTAAPPRTPGPSRRAALMVHELVAHDVEGDRARPARAPRRPDHRPQLGVPDPLDGGVPLLPAAAREGQQRGRVAQRPSSAFRSTRAQPASNGCPGRSRSITTGAWSDGIGFPFRASRSISAHTVRSATGRVTSR